MQSRTKSKKRALRAVIFLLVAALLYGVLTDVLSVNNPTDQRHIRGFYLEPKNSLDVVLIGASELYTGYCAPRMWKTCGFTSYPLSVSSAPACLYRSMLAEALRRQKPKVVVVEVNAFLYDFNEKDTKIGLHKWIYNIPLSANKLSTIRELVPGGQRMPYYFRLQKYHKNWRSPGLWGSALLQRLQMQRAGCSLTKGLEVSTTVCTDDVEPKYLDMSAENEQTLRDFCAYAQACGVENLLFVRFPHRGTVDDATVLPRMAAVVNDCGYSFLDLDTDAESLGLDRYHDFCDAEHMNVFGMEKFTAWFGQYLTAHYDLSGPHSRRTAARWDRCADFTDKLLSACEQKAAAGTQACFDEFSPEFRAWR